MSEGFDMLDQGDLMPNQLFSLEHYSYDHKAKTTVTHLLVHDKTQTLSYDIMHAEHEPVTKAKACEYLGDRGVALFKYLSDFFLSLSFFSFLPIYSYLLYV